MQRYCKLGEMQNKLELFLILGKKKEISTVEISFFQLGYPDSNQERQDQNLQCYHYTIPQCHLQENSFLNCGCKGTTFSGITKIFREKFSKESKNPAKRRDFYLFLVLSVDSLDFLSDKIHIVFQLLNFTVHFVDETIALLR